MLTSTTSVSSGAIARWRIPGVMWNGTRGSRSVACGFDPRRCSSRWPVRTMMVSSLTLWYWSDSCSPLPDVKDFADVNWGLGPMNSWPQGFLTIR